MITDLTTGNIRKLLWSFSIPMLISVAFQQMYNIADSVIAGRFIGEDALAAVGASYPITMIFMAIAIGSSAGCAVIISRLFGGRQYIHLKCAVSTIFITCVVMSVILTVFGVWQGQNMLRMLQTPENIFADGALYLISTYTGSCSCFCITSAQASSPLWGIPKHLCISSSAPL